jgi:ParB family chromosome partitioning protein
VRQAEKKKTRNVKGKPAKHHKDADTKALEASVSSSLGLDVKIEHEGDRGGTVKISYKTLEQLDEIIRRLNAFVEVD